ncbi:non-structural protein [Scaphoideus titanus reo-like virus 1]|nr:non-structural protein [Scaphoideus titanus reo-like virus 1]
MEVESRRVLDLHEGYLIKFCGHDITAKYDAIRRIKVKDETAARSNTVAAAIDKLRFFEKQEEAYVASNVLERGTDNGIYKGVIFMKRSILSEGRSIKDVLPYGVMVAAFVFLPETSGILDDIPVFIGQNKRPLTVCLISEVIEQLHLDIVGESYNSYYYCPLAAYGKTLLALNETKITIPSRIRLSIGDLCQCAASSLHTAATTYIRLFDDLPSGFSPRQHLFKIFGVLDMSLFKEIVSSKLKDNQGMFTYDDTKNILIRNNVFAADHGFTAIILWRGWSSTYMEFLSQEQQSQLQGSHMLGGDLGTFKFLYKSRFDDGHVYIQYKFITRSMLTRTTSTSGGLYPDLTDMKRDSRP